MLCFEVGQILYIGIYISVAAVIKIVNIDVSSLPNCTEFFHRF